MNDCDLFLASKSTNYNKINRFMMFRMYEKYKAFLPLKPIIHIIGTNGKGSTGRFLAQLLESLDFKVGHFTSPHLLKFNERFYVNGDIASDEVLNKTHNELEGIFKEDLQNLSYFEYCTFLAACLFRQCDFVIFEAGLGGEYDGTSVFDKKLSIFTRIGFDHREILGNTLAKIARTKLKVMAKNALISKEQDKETLDLAFKIALLKGANLKIGCEIQDKDLKEEFTIYTQKYSLVNFLKHNLNLALNACELLLSKDKTLEALRKIKALNLMGRCQKMSHNLYIDVGHNEMAATALCEIFKNEKLVLIYNSFLDKDIFVILKTLKPIIDIIKIYVYPSQDRELANERIFSFAKTLGIQCEWFKNLECDKKTLVFGSFVLVENFLREWSDKK